MQDDLYRTILNAMPMPVFVMDEQAHVQEINKAAAAFFEPGRQVVLKQKTGEVLRCINSQRGCGNSPECVNCVIRQSINAAVTGESVTRRRMRLHRLTQGTSSEVEMLVTACPLASGEEKLVVVVLEDITQLSTLKALLPMCMHCKKIRDDKQYWHMVENYFRAYLGVDFSHGVCPDCVKKLYSEEVKTEPSPAEG